MSSCQEIQATETFTLYHHQTTKQKIRTANQTRKRYFQGNFRSFPVWVPDKGEKKQIRKDNTHCVYRLNMSDPSSTQPLSSQEQQQQQPAPSQQSQTEPSQSQDPATTDPQSSNPNPSGSGESVQVKTEQDQDDLAGDDIDAAVEQDINMNVSGNAAAGSDAAGHAPNGTASLPTGIEAPGNPVAAFAGAPPTKKESSLREFLSKMDEYAPIVRWPCLSPPSDLVSNI